VGFQLVDTGADMATNDMLSADERTPSSGLEAGTAPEDRSFRPDVQGLRAVAVLLVVLYHAHVPGISGGYVGVDVFFVISGFVITGVLLRERTATGHTSIARFYARRARRIIPAATLVIIVAVIASYVLLGPISGNATSSDARWASVFLVNVHFADSGTNYLASLSPPSVLQNFWSLAVEEQFYLVYPAIVLILAAVSTRLSFRRRLGFVLCVAVIASLIYSIVQTRSNPGTAYFSVLPRVWELAIGGLVAVSTVELRRLSAPIAAVLSWLGLGLVLVAGFVFTASTAYPGWAVIVPAGGAALIIAGGTAAPAYGVEAVLRLRPLQWIGLISYSLYLWHWPILTIAAERRSTSNLPVADALLWVLVSLVLSIATYLLIENPIRRSKFLGSRRWASLLMGACLVASGLVVSTTAIHLHYQGPLATPGLAGLATGAGCPAPSKETVSSLLGEGATPRHETSTRLLVVGDSTACTMLPGLEAVGELTGIKVEDAAVIGCGEVSGRIAPSIISGKNVNSLTRFCQSRANAAVNSALKLGRPNVVVWSSTWERANLAVGSGSHQTVLKAGSSRWYHVLMERLTKRVRLFTNTGATVVLLSEPPFVDPGKPSSPTPEDKTFLRLNALLAKFAHNRPHVILLNLSDLVCPSGPPCPLIVNNLGLRGDGAHYTLEGSLYVARWLIPKLGIASPGADINSLPVIKVARPKSGATVHGVSVLDATANFYTGVTKIDLEVTGGSLRTATTYPATVSKYGWFYLWNTAQVANGTYSVRAIAYNAAGQTSRSKAVSIRVLNESG
jgi:peptidoglycan/LPS O-acetylase OafA/YrhL